MKWYWVGYIIVDNATGGQAGHGAMEVQLNGLPNSMQEVLKIADTITDLALGSGTLRPGHHVSVMSWSEMGS